MAQKQRSKQRNSDRMDVQIVEDNDNQLKENNDINESNEEELEQTFTPIQKLEVIIIKLIAIYLTLFLRFLIILLIIRGTA